MKYVPGPAFGQFSGSQGNTTASHNRFGTYTRNRTIPVNPVTNFQSTIRGQLIQLATGWRFLSDSQRAGWAALGEQMIRFDPLGVAYKLTGLQAYISVNIRRIRAGAAAVFDAPTLDGAWDLGTVTVVADTTPPTFNVTFSGTPPVGAVLNVFTTGDVSPGRNFSGRSEHRQILTQQNPTSPVNLLLAQVQRWGPLNIGQKISLLLEAVSVNFVAKDVRHVTTVVV